MAFDQNAKHENLAQKALRQKNDRLQTWAFAKLSHSNPLAASDCFVEYVSNPANLGCTHYSACHYLPALHVLCVLFVKIQFVKVQHIGSGLA